MSPAPKHPRRWFRSWSKEGIRIADFCVCLVTLIGLANAAFGTASFTLDIKLSLFERDVTTSIQRLGYIGLYSAISGLGFMYMLWRHNWRCELFTLVKIVAIWCVLIAVAPALQPGREPQTVAAVGGICVVILLGALSWSRRPV
jgi:hypothetical protein